MASAIAVSSPVLLDPTLAPRKAVWSEVVITGPLASVHVPSREVHHPQPAGVLALLQPVEPDPSVKKVPDLKGGVVGAVCVASCGSV